MRKALSFVSSFVLAGFSLPAFAQTAAPTTSNEGLEVVIVTAQKRSERLVDVPISITAISGDALVASARNNVADLQNAVPNLTIYSDNEFSPNIIVRGFESAAGNVGFESGFGVYVDGVFTGRTQSFLQELNDVSRLAALCSLSQVRP